MTIGNQPLKTARVELQPPLVSAADINEANYPRARFDESIAWTIKETARQRAPTRATVWRHQVGFAGELATAAYFDVEADWSISEDYIGDRGHDLVKGDARIEVKTVSREDDWQLKVPSDKVDAADYYVLTRCSNPSELVQMVGWTTRSRLETFGYQFEGDEVLRLEASHLYPFEPLFLPPQRIRASQDI